MGLGNPNAKMSKSETGSDYHAVYLLDPPSRARKKIMRAVTDSGREICFSRDPERAGVNNLLELYEALTAQSRDAIEQRFEGQGYGELKKAVAEAVVDTLGPIQQRYDALTRDSSYIDNLLARGAERANEVANSTLKTVRERMGFLEPLR